MLIRALRNVQAIDIVLIAVGCTSLIVALLLEITSAEIVGCQLGYGTLFPRFGAVAVAVCTILVFRAQDRILKYQFQRSEVLERAYLDLARQIGDPNSVGRRSQFAYYYDVGPNRSEEDENRDLLLQIVGFAVVILGTLVWAFGDLVIRGWAAICSA